MDGLEIRHSLHNEEFIRRSIKRQSRRVMRGAAMVEDEFVPTVGEIEEGIRQSLANPNAQEYGAEIPEEESTESCWEGFKKEITNPKWRILIFICMLTFGKQYIYDFPSSFGVGDGHTIQHRFNDHGKDYDNTMNQALYSVYSYPNTVLALVGGILIDRVLGLRKSVILFSCLITGGTLLFWLGVQLVEYPVMIAGRFIIGLGGESMTVAKTAFIARWFAGGKGMSLACSMTIALTRVAASLNFVVSPAVARSGGPDGACLVGVGVCGLATLGTVCLVICDIYFEKKGHVKVQQMGNGLVSEPLSARMLTMVKQIIKLPLQFWLICGACVCIYGADYPFIGYAKNFFEVKWDFESEQAGLALSLYQIASAVFSPLGGMMIDKVGHHAFIMVGCALAFSSMHVLMASTFFSPFAVVIIMGFVFSLVVPSLWPTIPCVVEPSLVAVGFGIMMSIQNIGMATIPLVVGTVLDAYPLPASNVTGVVKGKSSSAEGYQIVEWMMMGVGVLGAAFAVSLILVDRCRTRVLTVSPAKRIKALADMDAEREQEEEAEEARKRAIEEAADAMSGAGLSPDAIQQINSKWEDEQVRSTRRLPATYPADSTEQQGSEKEPLLGGPA